ncbi:hypothetical protein [Brevibacillus choshinensis]|nr:hypothetical protein [Brevibacillus choshinensis]
MESCDKFLQCSYECCLHVEDTEQMTDGYKYIFMTYPHLRYEGNAFYT